MPKKNSKPVITGPLAAQIGGNELLISRRMVNRIVAAIGRMPGTPTSIDIAHDPNVLCRPLIVNAVIRNDPEANALARSGKIAVPVRGRKPFWYTDLPARTRRKIVVKEPALKVAHVRFGKFSTNEATLEDAQVVEHQYKDLQRRLRSVMSPRASQKSSGVLVAHMTNQVKRETKQLQLVDQTAKALGTKEIELQRLVQARTKLEAAIVQLLNGGNVAKNVTETLVPLLSHSGVTKNIGSR